MCLAVPGKVIALHDGGAATVDMMGTRRDISLRLVPDAQLGDYVLVHAGFGIQVVDEQEAQRTIDLLREMDELLDDELPREGRVVA